MGKLLAVIKREYLERVRTKWFIITTLFGPVFFLIVTPIGVLLRMCGWDPLRRRPASRGRGWVPCPERHQDPQHYERLV